MEGTTHLQQCCPTCGTEVPLGADVVREMALLRQEMHNLQDRNQLLQEKLEFTQEQLRVAKAAQQTPTIPAARPLYQNSAEGMPAAKQLRLEPAPFAPAPSPSVAAAAAAAATSSASAYASAPPAVSTAQQLTDGPMLDSSGEPYYEISAKRRLSLNKYQSRYMFSIREWYDAGGVMKPGKGISLHVPEWNNLRDKVAIIDEKVTAGQEGPFFELGRNRRVTITKFSGGKTIFVDIREYYDQNGVMKPGKKGIALTPQQWDKLKLLVPVLTAYLPAEAAHEQASSSPSSAPQPPSPE